MAWGGGIDAQPLPQFPPAGTMGPCAGSQSWAATPVLVGPAGSRTDPAHTHLQEHVREQIQPCKDVWIFAPGEIQDQPRQHSALVSHYMDLPKNAPFPPKERWDLGWGGGGMQGLKTDPSTLQ